MNINFKLALKGLARTPGYTTVCVLLLALGVGLSTSAFSLANASLLAALPLPKGDQLLRVFATSPRSASLPFRREDYALVQSMGSFSSVAAYTSELQNIGEPGQTPETQRGLLVSANFLTTLGIEPALGRGFAADEDQPGHANVVLLQNSYWASRFGGDPSLIGRILSLGGDNVTVVGVLPASFDHMGKWSGQVFVRPLVMARSSVAPARARSYQVIARLRDGVSVAEAQAEADTAAVRLEKSPDRDTPAGFRLASLRDSDISESGRRWYWLTTALATLVLVIACTNLASLQLARAFAQRRAYAVRRALGASRFDLVAPLLAENAILTSAGGIAGCLIALGSNHVLQQAFWSGETIPFDGRVTAFAIGASLVAGLVFGLAPAWLASRGSTSDALKEISHGASAGKANRTLKLLLVTSQVALAMVLLNAALSFGLGSRNTLRAELGWQPSNFFSGWISSLGNYPSDTSKHQLIDRLRAELTKIPGVSDVSLSTDQPFYGYFGVTRFRLENDDKNTDNIALTVGVERGLFSLTEVPLMAGRLFPAGIKAGDPKLIVINETMARHLWPAGDAVGRTIRLGREAERSEIIGVVRDVVRSPTFARPDSPFQIFRPIEQVTSGGYSFLIKSRLSSAALSREVREAIARVDPALTVSYLGGAEEIIRQMVADVSDEKTATLAGLAAIGGLIALLGLYAVVNELTQQRNREMCIRIALGATHRTIVRLVLAQATKPIIGGLVAGGLCAVMMSRFYRETLPGLQLPGALLPAAIAGGLFLAGAAACYLPARKAARVNPVTALRAE